MKRAGLIMAVLGIMYLLQDGAGKELPEWFYEIENDIVKGFRAFGELINPRH